MRPDSRRSRWGPFFFYDNVLLNNGTGLRLYKSTPASATVYIVHNVIDNPTGVVYHNMNSVCWGDSWLKKQFPPGTPGFHIYNNVFVCDRPFGHSSGSENVVPNFKADWNVYTSPKLASLLLRGIDTHSLFETDVQFVDAAGGDWRLANGSPGKGRAGDLSTVDVAWPARIGHGGPDAGLLGISREKMPHGPVSGLWAVAEKTVGLSEPDVTKVLLPPTRWIVGKQLRFVLTPKADAETIRLTVFRTAVGKPSAATVTAVAEDGTELLGKTSAKTKGLVSLDLAIPCKGRKRITLTVADAYEAGWRIESPSAAVGVDLGETTRLQKYDGGRFLLDYRIDDPKVASFRAELQGRFSGVCKLEVLHPGAAAPEIVPPGGLIETHGKTGVYRLMLTFMKKADFRVEGPSRIVKIAPEQESAPLRPRWGRPAY